VAAPDHLPGLEAFGSAVVAGDPALLTVVGLRDSAGELNGSRPVVGSGGGGVVSITRDPDGFGGVSAITMAIELIKDYSLC